MKRKSFSFDDARDSDHLVFMSAFSGISEMDERIRGLLIRGLNRAGAVERSEVIVERFQPNPPTLASIGARTGHQRQSVDTRCQRAEPNAIAGAVCVACESGEKQDFDALFSPEFQFSLEPLRPSIVRAYDRATDGINGLPLDGAAWSRGWYYTERKLAQIVKDGIADRDEIASAIMCHVVMLLLMRRAPSGLDVAIGDTLNGLLRLGMRDVPFAHRLLTFGLTFSGLPDKFSALLREEAAFEREYLGFMMYSMADRRRRQRRRRGLPSFGELHVRNKLSWSTVSKHLEAAGFRADEAVEASILAAAYPVTNPMYHGGPLTPALACWISGTMRHAPSCLEAAVGLKQALSNLAVVLDQREGYLRAGLPPATWQPLENIIRQFKPQRALPSA